MALKVHRMTAEQVTTLIAAGALPPFLPSDIVVFGVTCEHADKPFFSAFPPSAHALLGAVFGPSAESSSGPTVMSALDQRRQSVAAFSQAVSCSCADAFWMQHGPAYPLTPGVSREEAEVCLRLAEGDRRTSKWPQLGH